MAFKRITGTFLDEITYDIPSSNWGEEEWDREFKIMKEAGIDTVIIIRSGLKDKLIFPSEVIPRYIKTFPVYQNLGELFLKLAEKYGMRLFWGLYDSGYYWYKNEWKKEVEINIAFSDEVWEKFGKSPAFTGWYLPHETGDTAFRIIDINTHLAEHLKKISNLPILTSPCFPMVGDYTKPPYGPRTLDLHIRQWEEIFENYQGLVDFCAFQDGTIMNLLELEDYVRETSKIAKKYGITLWSNVETFDRDMPIKFPPIDWRKLVYKIEVVQPYVEKLITFEFPHFLSPNSIWPSARNLYKRYMEFISSKE